MKCYLIRKSHGNASGGAEAGRRLREFVSPQNGEAVTDEWDDFETGGGCRNPWTVPAAILERDFLFCLVIKRDGVFSVHPHPPALKGKFLNLPLQDGISLFARIEDLMRGLVPDYKPWSSPMGRPQSPALKAVLRDRHKKAGESAP